MNARRFSKHPLPGLPAFRPGAFLMSACLALSGAAILSSGQAQTLAATAAVMAAAPPPVVPADPLAQVNRVQNQINQAQINQNQSSPAHPGHPIQTSAASSVVAPPALQPQASPSQASPSQASPSQPGAAPGLDGAASASTGAVPAAVVPPPPVTPPSVPESAPPPPAQTEDAIAVPGTENLEAIARINGTISQETIEQKLATLRQDRVLSNLKFEAEKAKAESALDEAKGIGKPKQKPGNANAEESRPSAYVTSIYRFGDQAYAEIMIGANKIVAEPGTDLLGGGRVVRIGNGYVLVKNRDKTERLFVRGSAGDNEQATAPALPAAGPTTSTQGFAPVVPASSVSPVIPPTVGVAPREAVDSSP